MSRRSTRSSSVKMQSFTPTLPKRKKSPDGEAPRPSVASATSRGRAGRVVSKIGSVG